MNLTIPNKFGFTTIGGETNDMNTVSIKPLASDCACNDLVQTDTPCKCPNQLMLGDPLLINDAPPMNSQAHGRFGLPVIQSFATGAAVNNVAATATGAVTGLVTKAKDLFNQNPRYFIVGGLALLWLLSSHKKHKLF